MGDAPQPEQVEFGCGHGSWAEHKSSPNHLRVTLSKYGSRLEATCGEVKNSMILT